MKRNFWTVLFLVIYQFSFAQDEKNIDYIRLHAQLAVEEMHLYKIPASITLSQGILETGGGQSRLAEIAHNHFGIKCKKEWTGPTISHTDDAPNECFRKYNSVQESYRDHSKFLAERPFYKALFTLDMHDYKAWAHGLKKAGYATNPKYAGILISRIEKYKLNEFDHLTPEQVQQKLEELYGVSPILALSHFNAPTENAYEIAIAEQPKVEQNKEETAIATAILPTKKIEVEKRAKNPLQRMKTHAVGIQYIEVDEGETLQSLAKLYDISVEKLAAYNELPNNGTLLPGQLVFFNKKKNKGAFKTYRVQDGESMYFIAQKVGIKIDRLYRLNRLSPGQQPQAGMNLKLK